MHQHNGRAFRLWAVTLKGQCHAIGGMGSSLNLRHGSASPQARPG